MKNAHVYVIGILLFLFLGIVWVVLQPFDKEEGGVTVIDSTEEVIVAEKDDLIKVFEPAPETVIQSPLTIRGEARGNWFFEGDFPVVLTNWDGLIIAEGYATAEGDWMTEEYIPFKATLEFEMPEVYPRGALILQKDNPSDLPEHDNALEFTVWYWEE